MFKDIRPVTLTPKAAIEVRKIMETKNIPADYGLRTSMAALGVSVTGLISLNIF